MSTAEKSFEHRSRMGIPPGRTAVGATSPPASRRVEALGGESSPTLAVSCEAFRAFEKNTLHGFLTLVVTPPGLRIKDCTFHRKNEASWIGFPARAYQQGGETVYANILEFVSHEDRARFQRQALAAVQRYIAEHGDDTNEPR